MIRRVVAQDLAEYLRCDGHEKEARRRVDAFQVKIGVPCLELVPLSSVVLKDNQKEDHQSFLVGGEGPQKDTPKYFSSTCSCNRSMARCMPHGSMPTSM